MDNLTVVIPFYNGHRTINRLLDSLPPELAVVIVDDLSDEPLRLRRQNTTVIRGRRKGYFTGAVNTGLEATATDALILNQDVWFEGNKWLDKLNELRRRYAVTGDPVIGHPAWPKGYIQGTFMYISRAAYEAAGPMNERDYPLWGSTAEWQARACRKGFEVYPWQDLADYGFRHQERKRGGYGTAITEVLRKQPTKKAQFIRTPPAVSIIVPCYNYGRFLSDAINSLIGGPTCLGEMPGQTFQSFEVIIVDDASQDDSREIARKLANDWQGIRLLPLSQNRGTPGAINAGIQASYGQFITILSADDMREPESLEHLYRVVENDPRAVAYDDIQVFKFGKRISHQRMHDYDFNKLIYKNQMHAGIMFSRQAWNEVGGYPVKMKYGREDWAFNVVLGVHGYCGVRVPEPGYLYRREKHNRSLRNTGRGWHERFLQQIQTMYPHIYEGDRPMPCCGGRNVANYANGNGGGAQMQALSVGEGGMVLIEYIGSNAGDETWFPPNAPRQTYLFGGSRRVGYVDQRHAEWFLNLKENGKHLFQQTSLKEPEIPQAEAEAVNPKAEAVEVAVKAAVRLPDPNALTVREIRDLELSADEWEQVLEAEKLGKNRTSAVDYMEAQVAG